MTATEYRSICNALMCKHHEQLLKAAIQRNDTNAVIQETATLKTLKTRI